jgi:voltage-gated potassium channel
MMQNSQNKTPTKVYGAGYYSAYDLFIIVLTIFSLSALVINFVPGISTAAKDIAFFMDTVACFFFIADFFRCLYRAPSKWTYLIKWGWLDLLGSLPGFPVFRVFRLARMFRLVRAMRKVGMQDIWHTVKTQRADSIIWLTILITFLLVGFASLMILRVETRSTTANIVTASDAIWWAMVTITTVGYGDKVPTTELGRLYAVALMIVGIGLFSVFTSYLAHTFLIHHFRSRDEELEIIRLELEQIKQLLQEQADS